MSFNEGFALGVQVRQLQDILKAIDAEVPILPQDETRHHSKCVGTVPQDRPEPDLDPACKEGLHLEHSLGTFIQSDYKPWCRISKG